MPPQARSRLDVVVVGAGAFGLACALRLAHAGASVRVLDRPGAHPNASAVAAGMLAPVSETLSEGGDREHLQRLMTARDLWPAFADLAPGLLIDRSGVEFLGANDTAMAPVITRLRGWGMDFAPLAPPRRGVRLGDDWRVDATTALLALRAALQQRGVKIAPASVTATEQGLRVEGAPIQAGAVVIAAGAGARALSAAAPELGLLSPIKGQIVAFAPGGPGGATLRGELYVAPQASGARAGATMEAGRDDTQVEPAVIEGLHKGALALQPALAGVPYRGEAGVRAATPDGWPLVGPSATQGLILAAGGRRNGWLLAPLVSQIVADAITGHPPHPLAQAFHPGRFSR